MAACAGNGHLVRRQIVHLLGAQEVVGREIQVAKFGCLFGIVEHRTANYAHLSPVFRGYVHHLLHAGDVGGERGDNDPPLGAGKDVVERFCNDLFRGGLAIRFGVGGIGEQDVDASPP